MKFVPLQDMCKPRARELPLHCARLQVHRDFILAAKDRVQRPPGAKSRRSRKTANRRQPQKAEGTAAAG